MPIWEKYSGSATLSTQFTNLTTEVLHNEEDTDNFQNADLVFVDGILTLNTNGDDLFLVRLILAHELMSSADAANVNFDDNGNWYQFFASRGPLVFRLRSKKTLHPQHKLWMSIIKENGNTSETLRWGLMIFEQLKH